MIPDWIIWETPWIKIQTDVVQVGGLVLCVEESQQIWYKCAEPYCRFGNSKESAKVYGLNSSKYFFYLAAATVV